MIVIHEEGGLKVDHESGRKAFELFLFVFKTVTFDGEFVEDGFDLACLVTGSTHWDFLICVVCCGIYW